MELTKLQFWLQGVCIHSIATRGTHYVSKEAPHILHQIALRHEFINECSVRTGLQT